MVDEARKWAAVCFALSVGWATSGCPLNPEDELKYIAEDEVVLDDRCVGANSVADADEDGVCDAADACFGDDASGDEDADGICGDLDFCRGDDASGDADGDGLCDDRDSCEGAEDGDDDSDGICDDWDVCWGPDGSGDADGDGICDELDACPEDALDDADGDGLCESEDPCPDDPHADCGVDPCYGVGDLDGDGVCDDVDLCPEDPAPECGELCFVEGDEDQDGLCDGSDPCPGDSKNDLDLDGLCSNEDPCPNDPHPDCGVDPCYEVGDADGDGICDDVDLCTGYDWLGDGDGDGVCDAHQPAPDTPPFYDQSGSDPGWTAGGVCVEYHGSGGPPACPEAEWLLTRGVIDHILTHYPFTNAIFDDPTSTGQRWAADPAILDCDGFSSDPQNAPIFDDINAAYFAQSQWNELFTAAKIEFDWNVNVWDLLSVYRERAALFGGDCALHPSGDDAVHGIYVSDDNGVPYWVVTVLADCSGTECACGGYVTGWSDPEDGTFSERRVSTQISTTVGDCSDPRF